MLETVFGCLIVFGVQAVSSPAPGYRIPGYAFVHVLDTYQSYDAYFHYCFDHGRHVLFVPRKES